MDVDLFGAVDNFMSAQTGDMEHEEPRMDQAQILALERAGVDIIDPPEPEDWYWDSTDGDMEAEDCDPFDPDYPR